MPTLTPGEVVAGRFEIVRALGAGGLAEVYAARDRAAGTEVAVKILHEHLAHDARLAERFRRELAVTRSLDHPSIVRVFELHEHAGRPLFSMELLPGKTLAERLAEGPMPADEARRIAVDIGLALQAAHRAGVVHRDLKPQNVFLCDSGMVKLLDFGHARAAGWARLTAQSTVLGTPGYLAPEVLHGQGADARADVYALGATLFEMRTGRPAFPPGDPYEIINKKSGPPPDPGPEPGEADRAVIRRALEPDPERRFLDAGQMVRALGGEPAPAAPPARPALPAGEHDVIVHGGLTDRRKLARVLEALAAHDLPPGFGARYSFVGTARLVSRVRREAAQNVVALCHAQGLAASVEPAGRARGRLGRWLGRAAGVIAGVAAASTGALWAWLAASAVSGSGRTPLQTLQATGWPIALSAAFLAVLGGSIAWLATGRGSEPAVPALEKGDASVRRLVEGVARRVWALERLPDSPLAAELKNAAQKLMLEALPLAERAAAVPDPLASEDPDAITLPPGSLEARDAAVQRLLEIAAALDAALADLRAGAERSEGVSALVRLREETAFAARALPEATKAPA